MKDCDDKRRCGGCVRCIHTHLGYECGLSDLPVDEEQEACIDYIPECEDYEEGE